MSLIRWNPYRNLAALPRDINRFFNDLGGDFWNSDTVWSPAVDITETEDGFEVKAEIPGMKKEEIKINYEDDMLTLAGERNHETEENGKNFHRIERRYGKFERRFHLPKNMKADSIKANYKDGVLTVSIPKSEEAKPKEIAIS
jgi:HSP20 family protein